MAQGFNAGLNAAAYLHKLELIRLNDMLKEADKAPARAKRTSAWIEARSLLVFGIKREEDWIKRIEELRQPD